MRNVNAAHRRRKHRDDQGELGSMIEATRVKRLTEKILRLEAECEQITARLERALSYLPAPTSEAIQAGLEIVGGGQAFDKPRPYTKKHDFMTEDPGNETELS